MKRIGKIKVVVLLIMAAGSMMAIAQPGRRGIMPDSSRMERMHRHRMMQDSDTLMKGEFEHRLARHRMPPMCPGMDYMWGRFGHPHYQMWPGPGAWHHDPRAGRQWMPGDEWMRGYGPWTGIMETVPGLTEKQRKEISELRQKQRQEMQEFRADIQKKTREMREATRTKIMNVLTDEQKKWVEKNLPELPALPAPPEAPEAPAK